MLNEQTLEFGQARLKLKNSLRFTMRKTGSRISYLVEDELTGKFFQIGLAQYTFLSMLNGHRTVNRALERTASMMREHAFDQQQVADLCKWAIESGLVETEAGTSPEYREKLADDETMRKAASALNPIMLKIPIGCPDGIITKATLFFGWLVSPVGAMLWLLVVVYGFSVLLLNAGRFFENQLSSFSANDLMWFALASLILKLIHELAHGIACKRYGGRISGCGILLMLFIPLPYVDVTSSWRFANKWHRILTAAAGMLCEIFIAAIACVIWVNSTPGPLQYHAGNVIITATIHTLIFNANPLMRFDGYYMLSDWLEIPNLSTHGRQYVKAFFKWLYFGNKPKLLPEIGWRAVAVKAYGFGTILWFFMISVGLSFGASSLMEGFGFLLAVAGLFLWFAMPVIKLIKYVIQGTKFEKPNRQWFAIAASITCVVVMVFLFACPSPSVVSGPVVIDYEPLGVVRAKVAGFANEIHVVEGQRVEEGQLLVTLDDPELQAELESLLVDISISELRIKTLVTEGEIASVKLEQENLQALGVRKREILKSVDNLQVRAHTSGTVLASDLDSKLKTYFKPGDELLAVGDQEHVQALALIKQQDIKWIGQNDNMEVDILLWGDSRQGSIRGKVVNANPRARDDLPHEAFAASNGGPLAVVSRSQVEGQHGDDQQQASQDMMLTRPRVQVEIELSSADRQEIFAGQTGVMLLRGRDEKMAGYLASRFFGMIKNNNLRTHGL